ncbi:gliding motility-associated protein GldE [uncultured Tenacibaculum sp.]|uniref:gliding motility-associated protein GldE n=1 Tax=uncultured Tenacibaculum sp. TaxID=174713 RepID=UPI00260208B6|nr:gliding motility-associated protein GldE [uncultured Tenacibaculum sp.]
MEPDPESLPFLLLSIDSLTILNCVALVLLLISSALVSGAEVAFFSISQTELDEVAERTKGRSTVVRLMSNPKKLLGTILITNNFINILIVLLFAALGEVFFVGLSDEVKFFIEVGLVTFLILLFGEVLPKVYATRKSLQFAGFMSKPILVLNTLLTPLSTVLIKLTSIVENRLGNRNNNLSVERLSQALELTSEDATTKDEQKILEGIVTFGNTETVQIMKPRTDVCAISDDASFTEVLSVILANGYSRNPVYHESIDNIKGVLYAKDLLAHLNKKNFKWQSLIRESFFVPENKKLDDLLSEFQEKKMHLAIVVDEYGGTSGIVTLEDVIEEIVGDINDEFDDDDLSYSKLDENNFIFEGKVTVKDFCRVLEEDEEGFEEDKGESETLAGFILEVSGKFPKKGEKINYKNYTFTIEVVDKKRIKQVKVTRNA